MTVTKFAILLLALAACGSQQSAKKEEGKLQGLMKYYYPDGKLYLEVNYKDSIPHGAMKVYYKTGQVQNESVYVNGVRHGTERTYYESGKLSTVTPYDSGRIHGVKKKFRRDGITAYEAPYYYDKPCAGLKEFFLSGQPVDNYPTVVVRHKDELLREGKYTILLSLSDDSGSVQFYRGKLSSQKYIGDDVLPLHVVNGVGHIYYFLGRGGFAMETVDVIAKIKTDLGNWYIATLSFNVAIEY